MASASRRDLFRRAFGRGVFPHELAWFLELPGRGLILSARTLADRLGLRPDARVLEVGPGSGYFSVEVARRVPQGSLALLDLQPEMLEKAARRLRAEGLTNVTTHPADGAAMPFEDGRFDVVFLVTVFGEIAAQDDFLAEAARVLTPGGLLSITEHHPDPDFEPVDAVSAALRRHGFVPAAPQGWRWAYTLNARKPGPGG